MIRFFSEKPDLFNEWRLTWSGPWSWISLAFFALLLAVAVYVSWRASGRLHKAWQRRFLLGARVLMAVSFWLLVAEPAIELRHVQKIQNYLPIFVDTSASMRIKDGSARSRSRLTRLKDFLKRHKSWFETLRREQRVRLYSFDRKVRRAGEGVGPLRADGDQSDLLRIARFLKERYNDRPLAGVILMTDGVDTLALGGKSSGTATRKDVTKARDARTSRRLTELVALLKQLKVPVHVVTPRRRDSIRDLAITDVYGDTFAFLQNKVTIEARVKVVGLSSGTVPINLYQEGQLLRSQVLTLKPGQNEYLLSFTFRPRKAGKFIYSIKAPVLTGEAVTENNQKSFILKIIRDRIRVLQVAGRPSWDVRFMRRLLKKNANIDLISFFILRTWFNPQRVPKEEMALIPFPSEELFTKTIKTFDLVIFQNFNFGPYMPRLYLDNIRDFVQNGGAFVMVGGDLSFGAGGYLNTSIEQMLPVRLGLGRVDTKLFRPKLTLAGQHHPITKLAFHHKATAKLWQTLPKVQGCNLLGEPLTGGVNLLEHPTLRTDDGKPRPILSVGQFGKGRVMTLAIDESWKWNLGSVGQGGTSASYYRFWNNAIRWLIRDPELERIRVISDRTSYRADETTRFRIRVFDRRYQPQRSGKVRVQVFQVPSTKPLYEGAVSLRQNGEAGFRWKPTRSGMYRIKASFGKGKRNQVSGAELFEVRGVLDEFQQIQPNIALFQRIQKATQGQIVYLDGSPDAIKLREPTVVRINRSKTVELWDKLPILLFLFGLLSTEWWFRRRWGLP